MKATLHSNGEMVFAAADVSQPGFAFLSEVTPWIYTTITSYDMSGTTMVLNQTLLVW